MSLLFNRRFATSARRLLFLLPVFILVSVSSPATAQNTGGSAIAPQSMVDVKSSDAEKQMKPDQGDPTFKVDKSGVSVSFPGGPAQYPGFFIKPASGASWDLSPFGHVEAKVTNTGDKPISVNMRVDGAEGYKEANTETVSVKPGESNVLKVIFGYQYGYKPGPAVNPSKITELLVFLNKSADPRSFRMEDIQGAGSAGEKPPVDPNAIVTTPKNGVILGKGVELDVAKQVEAGSEKVSAAPNGALAIDFAGGKEETVKIKPPVGAWSFIEGNELRVKVKNSGTAPSTPLVAVGPYKVVADKPLAPGAETELKLSFIPAVSAVGIAEIKGMYNGVTSGTGSNFENTKVKAITVGVDKSPAPQSLLVTSIQLGATPEETPNWLGKKPPVDGDWVMTFEDNFDKPPVDFKKWNIYGPNFWDKRTHWSKDNLVFKDGKLIFHYEKKTGPFNDNPAEKQTDYACGYLNSFGKWTQRYGYFESRMKLPHAPGLWPAFWLMPDRGKAVGAQWKRSSTGKVDVDTGVGGMEFDIMEYLSGWGIYRFNVALHWDGYGKEHKSVGCTNIFVQADKDGYITTGLLWLPGKVVIYNNGKEVFRWENPRVCDTQCYLMWDMVSGGWANVALDDTKLPDDFFIDYVRVWQRKDLASPEDGPKENSGDPDERKN